MRVSEHEKETLKHAALARFGHGTRLRLFGSRADEVHFIGSYLNEAISAVPLLVALLVGIAPVIEGLQQT